MDPNTSMSESQPSRAFYLPAMATLSSVPGRIGRFLAARGRDHSRLTAGPVAPEPTRSFYLPAVVSGLPGRVERFIDARRHVASAARVGAVSERIREFYLPGTFRR